MRPISTGVQIMEGQTGSGPGANRADVATSGDITTVSALPGAARQGQRPWEGYARPYLTGAGTCGTCITCGDVIVAGATRCLDPDGGRQRPARIYDPRNGQYTMKNYVFDLDDARQTEEDTTLKLVQGGGVRSIRVPFQNISSPMPPRMPAPRPPAGSSLAGTSVMMTSLVVIMDATLAASARAVRTTLTGSMMPALSMSTYSPVDAFIPFVLCVLPFDSFSRLPTTTAPSRPALLQMALQGTFRAAAMILTPWLWSTFAAGSLSRPWEAYRRATPPPGTMPSSTAARVAFSASSIRSLRSPTSTSLAPPTLTTATPDASFARRDSSFSVTYLVVYGDHRSSRAQIPAPTWSCWRRLAISGTFGTCLGQSGKGHALGGVS